MLLRCCLIHKCNIILRHFLYLLYFYPCLGLGLFTSYLRDLIFIFTFIFIVIDRIISGIQRYMLFPYFQNMFYYFQMIMWMKNVNNFQITKFRPQGVAQHLLDFFFANFSLTLLIKVLLIKKSVQAETFQCSDWYNVVYKSSSKYQSVECKFLR